LPCGEAPSPSSESVNPSDYETLQTVTAVVETGAGLALMGFPSVTASLLLGTPLNSSAAESLARVGGAAILTLAIVCWLARRHANRLALQGLVAAMAFYNIAVAAVLASASLGEELRGPLLWPAVAFHVAMSVWCVTILMGKDEGLSH
jgi:hypothetical protein